MNSQKGMISIRESVRRILLEASASSIPFDSNNFAGLDGLEIPKSSLESFCKIMFEKMGSTTFTAKDISKTFGPVEFAAYILKESDQDMEAASTRLTILVFRTYNNLIPSGLRIKDAEGNEAMYTAKDILSSYKSFTSSLNDSLAKSAGVSPIRTGYMGLVDILSILSKQREKIKTAVGSAAASDKTVASPDAAVSSGLTSEDIAEVGVELARSFGEAAEQLAVYAEEIANEFNSTYIDGENIDTIVESIIRAYDDKSIFVPIPGEVDQGVRRVEIVIKEAETLAASKNLAATVGLAAAGASALGLYWLSKGTLPAKLSKYGEVRDDAVTKLVDAGKKIEAQLAASPAAASQEKDKLESALKAAGLDVAAITSSSSTIRSGSVKRIDPNISSLITKWVDASNRANPTAIGQAVSDRSVQAATADWNKAVAQLDDLESVMKRYTDNAGELVLTNNPTVGGRIRLTFDPKIGNVASLSNIARSPVRAVGTIAAVAIGSVFARSIEAEADADGAKGDIISLMISPGLRSNFSSSDGAMLDDLTGMFDELGLESGESTYDKYIITKAKGSGEPYKVTEGRKSIIRLLKSLILNALESDFVGLDSDIKSLKEAYQAPKGK